ncbi:Pleckstrin homology (PH) domain superfamily protein [Striga hermonthica]|uniref:Pleckstrin homology (PH) domain superfamily protein n=1 Tax=Striga hermonthica TaxID=68872 RepID=A0A9N7N1U2_STRHE|nr:Pleckstrin homology (PH) domain superfamily protein [Striga hermonthica]
MMRGTKRSAISEPTPLFNSNDTFMQSKKAVMGSQFAADKAETSIRQPPLDAQRAESSRRHVRALNTQFASWIQSQLQNHPDELWEDGVQDYLNHAKSIMEKFSDVVNWLRTNTVEGGGIAKVPSEDAQTKPLFGIDQSSHTLFPDKPGPTLFSDKPMFPAASTASSGTPWRPTLLFNNNSTPFTFGGSQVSVPGIGNANVVTSNHDTSNEPDGEDDIEQPSSPSVKKNQEEGIIVVHEVKCKLYVKSSDPADEGAWKDKGTGQLSIKCKEGISKGTKESKPTIVIRNDVGKLLLNALIYPGIKTNLQKNSVVTIFHTSDDGDNNEKVVARTFLMRTKTEEDRDKLAAAIQDCAPSS